MSDQADLEKNIPPDLFSLLGKFMQSAASDSGDGSSATSAATVNASSAGAEQKAAGGDILSSLLSNPEIITKLPQVISMLKPLMEGGASAPTMAPSPTAASAPNTAHADTPAGLIKPPRRECDNRAALLYALKPYLKRERQEAIDYMVKLSKLGDILKSL